MTSSDRIKLRHLNCLVAVAEFGNFVKAADALAVTQPAVTKTILELEAIVGQPLVLRRRHGLALTAAGQVLVLYAGSSLRTIREGLDSISRTEAPQAPVIMIGALPNVAITLLPMAIAVFEAQVSRARITVRTGSNAQLIAALRQGELDVVIGRMAESSDMRGLSFEHIFTEDLVFTVRPGHPLLRARTVTPRSLTEYRLVLPDEGTRIRKAADNFFVSSGLNLPENVIQTIDVSFGRSYMLQSDAVWCTPQGVVARDLQAGVLHRLALDTRSTSGPVGISMRADKPASEALQLLINALRDSAPQGD